MEAVIGDQRGDLSSANIEERKRNETKGERSEAVEAIGAIEKGIGIVETIGTEIERGTAIRDGR
jgi:hypothetical protein